jgi:hypothetical protein
MHLKSHLKSRVPAYSVILAITVLSNGFNNIKKKGFFFNHVNYPLPNQNETLSSIFKVRKVEYQKHHMK